MTMTPDHPNVRQSTTCPLCLEAKPQGLVACWPCFRAYKMRYGNPKVEAHIARREAEMTERRTMAPPPRVF